MWRMILAFHVIFCAYGFWLPNDPRGSWSDFVWAWELLRFGKATTTDTRRSVAGAAHDRAQREAAKAALKYPPVKFDGHQAVSIAKGFREAIMEGGYRVHACAILPEHVHLVIGWHERDIRRIVSHLKAKATMQLRAYGRHPLAMFADDQGDVPTPWARKSWDVYLFTAADVRRAMGYVENNPMKEGKQPQHWPFVVPYV